ncbi:hypothetical protein ACPOL_0077 [Acidisarcina polymorpha]|uniref:Death on curing protein, Doc toxin n=1 Tax=Acidisarcina polymorpha TaxID=2211140 RepID=A0A2Z5FSL8_9BACT|nr:hypothetical protein ACPOL_0077 [Acidisarcina polymorpha]
MDEIWDYIARNSAEAADRWIDSLYEAFEFVSRTPGCGHTRADLTDKDVRFWAFKTYVILYREREDRVIIEAVTQGSRHVPSFLSKRQE